MNLKKRSEQSPRDAGSHSLVRQFGDLLAYCKANTFPDYLIQQSRDFRDHLWKVYLDIFRDLPISLEGKVVLDFGCKYGHTLPIFLFLGAARAIGVDVEPEYVEFGRLAFERLYEGRTDILSSDHGLIPIQPESVDFVYVNEVISHVNPMYQDTVYSEIARILKPGGSVFLSDGNNGANSRVRRETRKLWELYENGPDGVETDRDIVTKSYLSWRKEIIASAHPQLTPEQVDYAARNTSGLFGERLAEVIDEYVRTGDLIRRPYRPGTCPTNPIASGVVIERCLHPLQVTMSLADYAIEARQFYPRPKHGWKGKLYFPVRNLLKSIIRPMWRTTESEGFRIIGIKRS